MQNTATIRLRAERRQHLRSTLRQAAKSWQIYLMMLPALVILFLFAYKPMYGIIIAFKKYDFISGINGSPWVGFANFKSLFTSYWFPVIMKNTLTISLLSLVMGFPFPIIFALMLNEVGSAKIKQIVQTVSYAPHFISTVVICGMIIMFLNPTSGIINLALQALGHKAVQFMGIPEAFKWVYVISGIWQGTGWGAIIYFAALSGVDSALLEAAEIDGASRFQKIIYINFPVLVPTILIMFILNCGSLLNVGYEKVYALQNSSNQMGSEVISTYVYRMGLVNKDFSFSTAAGLFNSVVNSAILLVSNWVSNRAAKVSLF